MRLIDADALLDKLEDEPYDVISMHYDDGFSFERITKIICDEPVLDAEDLIPHGKWVISDNIDEFCGLHECSCSICGFIDLFYEYKYCPNCGAKMDKGE